MSPSERAEIDQHPAQRGQVCAAGTIARGLYTKGEYTQRRCFGDYRADSRTAVHFSTANGSFPEGPPPMGRVVSRRAIFMLIATEEKLN
jgi:hypothetical protein